ncbi:MAG: T9SS type A sorting domain-containing protein [Chitinophagales bacterium]
MLGYNFTSTYPDLGFQFTNDTLEMFTFQRPMGFFLTDAGICDTLGNLLFYTNGITIENANHDTLFDSEGFNPGWATDYYDNGVLGLGMYGGAIIIPRPNYPLQYYLFHESAEIFLMPFGSDVNPLDLRYSLVDMSLDNGLGGIVSGKKKVVIINDTLQYGRIAACKHANGRDWWMIVHQYFNDRYYKLLITPDSIYGPFEQEIGFKVSYYDDVGNAIFSPDGSKYVLMENRDSIDIFDFDRCTGELSNEVFIHVPDMEVTTGCTISESGRFLYVGTYAHIFQYDLWSNDVPNSGMIIAEYQDTVSGLDRWFAGMQRGSDNRIYVSTWSGIHWMHYIKYPDSLGVACDVVQSGLDLPSYNASTVPNFPNYDLGSLQGSPCDTLTTSQSSLINDNFEIRLSPNPASSTINIEYKTDQVLQMKLVDITGKQRMQIKLYPYFRNRLAHVEDLPEGIYLAVFILNNKTIMMTKISIVR